MPARSSRWARCSSVPRSASSRCSVRADRQDPQALAVAERLQDDWRDGVVFVALQSISEPELVASAIAQALGVRESGEQSLLDSLRAALHHRNLLLILDNFEQVLPAAPLVTDLLTNCPH